MGKYFSSDSDLTKFNISEEKQTSAIPSADNLTSPLPTASKEKLSIVRQENMPMTQDEHIDMVRVQADAASEMVNKYSKDTKKMIEQQFEKFAPIELFEKLNQVIFTLADLSNRISKLEKKIDAISTGVVIPERKPIEITDPEQLYRLQNKLDEFSKTTPEPIPESQDNENIGVEDRPSIEEIKKRLSDAKSGKVRKLPDEGLTDESVKLEEMFPNLDSEAYTAAYSAMSKYNKVESTEATKPAPGTMRNLTGF